MELKNKLIAIAMALGIGIASFCTGALMFPTEKVITITEHNETVKYVDVPFEVEVIKEVPVNVTVEVPVDNGNLKTVLDYLYDNDGELGDMLEDLDDNEVNQIVDRILMEGVVKAKAEELVKKEGLKYLDDETDIFTDGILEQYRDNDVYSFKLDTDETSLTPYDYEDREFTVLCEVTMKLDDEDDKAKETVRFEIEVEGNSYEIVDAELVI